MPLDPTCWHTAGACLCADLDRMPESEIQKYLERRKARQVEAVARQVEQDKALREPPTASVEPGSGYAARRAAGEGGHGMAERVFPPVARGAEGAPSGVIGLVRARYDGLAASPLRTDAEEAELRHLGAMLDAVGLEAWTPVPREPLPPYPGEELVPAPEVPAPGDMTAAILAAPLDGTPETPEERAAFEAIDADIQAGRRGAGPAEIEARLREMRAASCLSRYHGVACEKRGPHGAHGTLDGLNMWLASAADATIDSASPEAAK